ncbi:MAG TPA: BtrH N-terminal domain-containing protein [Solirubrobacterales bacterium]
MPEQTGTDPDERAAQVAPVLVPGFEHRPGHHCGSTALRNLLCFHGAQLSEELAFGLGAGPCFYFVPMEGSSPSRFINGRTRQLEEEFVRLTGAPLELETFPGPDASWEAARAVVDSGAPALLLTDLYYLDHYGTSAHFPGHAVVLAGYDSTHAYVADTAFEGLQRTSLEGLRRARHGEHPVFPLAGHMFTVIGDVERFDFAAAADAAIAAATRRMFEPALGEFEGLPALRRFAAEVGEWPGLLDDWQWAARFAYQVIERRGTGGGNFRAMYGRFLDEVANPAGPAAHEAAARWSELAAELLAASEEEAPSAERWQRIGAAADAVLAAETKLWERLAS